ncbi:HAD hydrolase-like protein [Lutispora sp.]|nr:HAD hydrolase-like protein [Lutispora sp.]MEA4961634.1 HAD hydrolase-like protein [Lutispora sp.]
MVGDSPTSDIQGAVNAEIDSCFYQHNKSVICTYAKYTIRDISELLDIV